MRRGSGVDPRDRGGPCMTEVTVEQVSITIDGRTVAVAKGELLIKAAQEHGTYIPRFCWHERMKPVGMCRMCLVEVEGIRGLPPACTLPVADGMVVNTVSDAVRQAQDGVLELLLVNHPLDCPVCDRGGECPLQDTTLAFGPGESRFGEEKRHWEKPIPISDLVLLDRERCIQCARCTRFADEIAGDALISFYDRGGHTEIATFPDEPFASYFSGNTVQICPVGALTAKPYRFRARPWDLAATETSCTTCAVHCRGALESSSNRLVRLLGIDSEPVNHGWLCDKGRYGYEASHHDSRVLHPMIRRGDELVRCSWPEALDAAADALRVALASKGASAIGVLGGARGTNEDAYVWARFAKGVLRTDNVDAQPGDGLPAEVALGLPGATIADLDRAGAIVVLGVDLKEELPVLYLRARRRGRRPRRPAGGDPLDRDRSRALCRGLAAPGTRRAGRDHGRARAPRSTAAPRGMPTSMPPPPRSVRRDGELIVVAGRGNLAASGRRHDRRVRTASRPAGTRVPPRAASEQRPRGARPRTRPGLPSRSGDARGRSGVVRGGVGRRPGRDRSRRGRDPGVGRGGRHRSARAARCRPPRRLSGSRSRDPRARGCAVHDRGRHVPHRQHERRGRVPPDHGVGRAGRIGDEHRGPCPARLRAGVARGDRDARLARRRRAGAASARGLRPRDGGRGPGRDRPGGAGARRCGCRTPPAGA